MHFFTPNHVFLIEACYPSSSVLLSAGFDFRPNSQELSRLTYYAANRPGKIDKVGSELEKRVNVYCHRASTGNSRARASLLITLAILRMLAAECRRNIDHLSPSLVSCLRITLDSLSFDLEVCEQAASVFTTWCNYADGHVIGVDARLTQSYLAVIKHFAALVCTAERQTFGHEPRNRTSIGLAAVIGVVNSEALYASAAQFKPQALLLTGALLAHIIYADLKVLDDCVQITKEGAGSVYLAEFRTHPVSDRKAASIHVHVDGEAGPSPVDVLTASLRGLSQLFKYSNAAQVGSLMQAAFENLDSSQFWSQTDQCRWFAQRACEWTQYQYRYAIPCRLVEQLLEIQDTPVSTRQQKTLLSMLTAVFTSPTSLVNLSTSDIVSSLVTLVFRRVLVNPNDDLLPLLVESIASLGARVYYSDQIQDLASELVSRLATIDIQSSFAQQKEVTQNRSQAIRCLLAGLMGLMLAADEHRNARTGEQPHPSLGGPGISPCSPTRAYQRTKVSGEIWHDTLSLLCDSDFAVRSDYAQALVTYLRREVPTVHVDGARCSRTPLEKNATTQANSIGMMLFGDSVTRSLQAVHAYLFVLATSFSLGSSLGVSTLPAHHLGGDMAISGLPTVADTEVDHSRNGDTIDAYPSTSNPRRSIDPVVRSRRSSNTHRLFERVSEKLSSSTLASPSDYALILHVLTAIHEEVPVRGLLTGIPMLMALESATRVEGPDTFIRLRAMTLRETLTRVWLVIGRVWDCQELVYRAEQELSIMRGPMTLPQVAPFTPGILGPPQEQISFPELSEANWSCEWTGIRSEEVLSLLASSTIVQEATALDQQGLLRRLGTKWTVEGALRDSIELPNPNRLVAEGGSPLLKLSPALMAIENLSLQSLTRSVRGVGVMDLREALEGRAGASNPALVRPPSVSTLDHSLSLDFHPTRHALAPKKPKKRIVTSGSGEVRDVLNKLGIGKYSGNSLLKASFPSTQKPDAK